jgi:8-oxo-dGTP pyrophosphatase MutT (NUDIX family)
MDYILQLRQLVGHRPILIVGASALIVDAEGRLLLLKRSDNDCWGIPGGGVEPGEFVEAAARREAREETGLELGEMALFGVFSGPELYYVYPNGDETYNVIITYITHQAHGAVRINDEHTDWRWFTPADIPEDLSPPIRPIIQQFKASISF